MTAQTRDKLERLRNWFDPHESVLVAYSGGVDSALVAAVAHQQLGDRMLACIGVSPSYPDRERRQAVEMARELGMAYRLIDTQEHLDDRYAANAADRCYFCKSELYGQLHKIAGEEGWQVVADGTNESDLGDDRPGMVAGDEQGVCSPLLELGISKDQVRQIARELDISAWDKPAMACLSSRVPHGTAITPQLLRQVEQAEDVLFEQGFAQFRVRHHGELARIEVLVEDLPRALQLRETLAVGIRAAGYRHICLDLAGFRGQPAKGDQPPVQLTIKGDQ